MLDRVHVALPSGSHGPTLEIRIDVQNSTVGDLLGRILSEHHGVVCSIAPIWSNDALHITEASPAGPSSASASTDDDDLQTKAQNEQWAIQRVLISPSNRRWTDEQLRLLHEFTRPLETSLTLVEALHTSLNDTSFGDATSNPPADVLLSQQLDVALLRLVHRPSLVRVVFEDVPGIPRKYTLDHYVSRSTISADVIEDLLEEYGLLRAFAVAGRSVRIEYELLGGDGQPLSPTLSLLQTKSAEEGQNSPHRVHLRLNQQWLFSLSQEAQDRIKGLARDTWAASLHEPEEGGVSLEADALSRRPASLFGSVLPRSPTQRRSSESRRSTGSGEWLPSDDGEGDRTIKASNTPSPARPSASSGTRSSGQTYAKRLSSIFGGWAYAKADDTTKVERSRIVSGPRPLTDVANNDLLDSHLFKVPETIEGAVNGPVPTDQIDRDMEKLMDELGLKPAARSHMRAFDPQKKRQLLEQHRHSRLAAGSHKDHGERELDIISPVSTGSSTMSYVKRFSMAALGGYPFSEEGSSNEHASIFNEKTSTVAPLEQTTTGWTSWLSAGTYTMPFASTAGKASSARDMPAWYLKQVQEGGLAGNALVKHLIALRVRLSTEQLAWADTFAETGGIECLDSLLKKAVTKSKTRRDREADSDEATQIECVRCLRILANTSYGFERLLKSEAITSLTFTLWASSFKLRALVAETLAGLGFVGKQMGESVHDRILASFFDAKNEFGESYRFQHLIKSIAISDACSDDAASISSRSEIGLSEDEPTLWEYRRAVLALLNTLTSLSDDLEERVSLRDELARRGFNEVITILRYMETPDDLQAQIRVYLEEKQEDVELSKSRAQRRLEVREIDQTLAALDPEQRLMLELLSNADANRRQTILELLELVISVISREMEEPFRDKLVYIIRTFLEQMENIDDFAEGWDSGMAAFLQSISSIVGPHILLRGVADSQPSSTPQILLDELEKLRATIQISEASEREASAPALGGSDNTRQEEAPAQSGLIQKLVDTENRMTMLESEVESLLQVNRRYRGLQSKHDDDVRVRNQQSEESQTIFKRAYEELASSVDIETGDLPMPQTGSDYVQAAKALMERCIENQRASREKAKIDAMNLLNQADRVRMEGLAAIQQASHGTTAALASPGLTSPTAKAAAEPSLQEFPSDRLSDGSQPTRTSDAFTPVPPSLPVPVAPPPPPPPPSVTSPATQPAVAAVSSISVVTGRQASQQDGAIPQISRDPPLAGAVIPSDSRTIPLPPPPPPPPQPSSTTGPAVSRGSLPAPPPPPPPPAPLRSSTLPTAPPPPTIPKPPVAPVVTDQAQVKTKPFFWNKIPDPRVDGTIWATLRSDAFEIDTDQLRRSFAVETHTKSSSSKVAGAAQTKKSKPVSVVSTGKAQNIGIMLARFRISTDTIRDAVLKVDSRKLTIERLRAIKATAPTADEIVLLKKQMAKDAQLADSDQYLCTIMVIPRLEQRISCMITRQRFELDMEEIRPELAMLRHAIDETRQSCKLRTVLQCVLSTGNALNARTFRGNARGFQLEALSKLRDARASSLASASADPEGGTVFQLPTLLHFVADQLAKKDMALVNFLTDCPHVNAAARISVESLKNSVTTITKAIEEVRSEVEHQLATAQDPKDRFVPLMTVFLSEAEPAMQALKGMMSDLQRDLLELLRYFGEEEVTSSGPTGTTNQARSEEGLFVILANFASSLQVAHEENVEMRRRQEAVSRSKRRLRGHPPSSLTSTSTSTSTSASASVSVSVSGSASASEGEESAAAAAAAKGLSGDAASRRPKVEDGHLGTAHATYFHPRSIGRRTSTFLTTGGGAASEGAIFDSALRDLRSGTSVSTLRMHTGDVGSINSSSMRGNKRQQRQEGSSMTIRPLSRIFYDGSRR